MTTMATSSALPGQLTSEEQSELSWCEAVIEKGLGTFYEVGSALLTIRDRRLYRETHKSFERYCQERWEISGRQGYRLIDAAKVIKSLESAGATTLPASESAARPLGVLTPEKQTEVWEEAVAAAPDGKPTARDVAEAVEKVRPIGHSSEEPSDVEVIEPDDEIDVEVSPEPMSDQEWLSTLPAREKLSEDRRRHFDIEALLFNEVSEHRIRYAESCRPLTNLAKREGKGNIGPWMSRHFSYLRLNDPSRWTSCEPCSGTGYLDVSGKCPECKGHGYHV